MIQKIGSPIRKVLPTQHLHLFYQRSSTTLGAEAIVHRQEELLLDKRCVAAEQAILSHNLHTHKIPHKISLSSVNAAEWSKAIDIEFNELQRFKTWDRVNISLLVVYHKHLFHL